MTEKDIILGCQNGEALYQRELVERYSPMLLTVCRRYTRDLDSAKDVLQDSMIKIFRNIHRYRPIGSFKGWMTRICINTALQMLDKSCFKREISCLDELIHQPSTMPDVYSLLGAEELMDIIATMPEGFKQVFNLSIVEGFSHKEIAGILGINESTSRSQLVRARNYLKKLLLKRDRIRV